LLRSDHDRAEADPNVYSFCDKPLRLEKLLELVSGFQKRRDAQRPAA
jgi:hypothetical protein